MNLIFKLTDFSKIELIDLGSGLYRAERTLKNGELTTLKSWYLTNSVNPSKIGGQLGLTAKKLAYGDLNVKDWSIVYDIGNTLEFLQIQKAKEKTTPRGR
jgi:hypothetical protein